MHPFRVLDSLRRILAIRLADTNSVVTVRFRTVACTTLFELGSCKVPLFQSIIGLISLRNLYPGPDLCKWSGKQDQVSWQPDV